MQTWILVSRGFIWLSVDDYFAVSKSCAINGGGSNLELAHHVLNMHRSIKTALKLLLRRKTRVLESTCPFLDYPYQCSTYWTQAERISFNRAWKNHGKDFFLISKEVRTLILNTMNGEDLLIDII